MDNYNTQGDILIKINQIYANSTLEKTFLSIVKDSSIKTTSFIKALKIEAKNLLRMEENKKIDTLNTKNDHNGLVER